MKRTLIIVISLLIGFMNMAQEKQTRRELRRIEQERVALQVDSILKSNNYTFTARSANPLGWSTIHISPNYTLSVDSGQLNCHLPYFGRAYRANLSSSQGGIILDTKLTDYSIISKKKETQINFKASDTNDSYRFTLKVSTSGNATLTINSNNRQGISYNGVISGKGR